GGSIDEEGGRRRRSSCRRTDFSLSGRGGARHRRGSVPPRAATFRLRRQPRPVSNASGRARAVDRWPAGGGPGGAGDGAARTLSSAAVAPTRGGFRQDAVVSNLVATDDGGI